MKNIIIKNLKEIQAAIAPLSPTIIAVTKYGGEEYIIAAHSAGLRNFAENRIVEASAKINSLPNDIRKSSHFHFIGHLQTNKVKKAIAVFDLIHSVDSLNLAKAISDEAQRQSKIQQVLLQVNNACEAQKFGFSNQELFTQFTKINNLPGIKVIGLMNMTPLGSSDSESRTLFNNLAEIKTQLEHLHKINLPELSMGMSNDFIQAALAGATMLRIGSKLFR